MPYWYPYDYSGFSDYHGKDLPRVVDDADVLTDEEEAELDEKITQMVNELGVGYVIFTDDSNHGLSPEEYSSDFLHFNGYGVGDEYGAVVFYLCFEPGDRCWRTTSINSYERIFTSDVTYEIDETIDSSIRNGDYFGGCMLHAEYVEDMFSRLSDLPDWYPEGAKISELSRKDRSYPAYTDASKPRVTDNAGLFTPEQIEDYTAKLEKLSDKYKTDVIVFTDVDYHALTFDDYASDFYYYHGYSERGVILLLVDNDEYWGCTVVTFGGDPLYKNEYDLWEAVVGVIREKESYTDGVDEFLRCSKTVVAHGHMPLSTGAKLKIAAIGLIAGLIVAFLRVSALKNTMKVTVPTGAGNYLIKDSYLIRNRRCDYLYTTVSRRARPKQSSSGGGGRGGSSYSSGRSSGGSYSSGGRSF